MAQCFLTAEKFRTSQQSNWGSWQARRRAALGIGNIDLGSYSVLGSGGGDTLLCAGMLHRDLCWLNGAVPSSSFLPACNYGMIAQSGIVGGDVYTLAIVQDLGGRAQKKKKANLHCKCPGLIQAFTLSSCLSPKFFFFGLLTSAK